MKYLLVLLIIFIYGCGEPYPNENRLIQKAYHDGYEQGKKECQDSDTLGIISKLWNKINKPTVDSIEFKYDSIMVIHYNKSEIPK